MSDEPIFKDSDPDELKIKLLAAEIKYLKKVFETHHLAIQGIEKTLMEIIEAIRKSK